MEKKWLYKVENDKISVLLSLIVTVIFAAVTAVLHGFIITLVFTIVMAALTLCSAYRFIYFFVHSHPHLRVRSVYRRPKHIYSFILHRTAHNMHQSQL